MNFRIAAAGLALAAFSAPVAVSAQDMAAEAVVTEAVAEAPVVAAAPAWLAMVPANTPIELTLNSPLSSKNNVTGDKFSMTVAQDVMVDGRIAVPKGTRAVGLVTYAKGNGSFGKSGKMEVAFKYLELGGKQIPLDGVYYQEGEGNTAGTVGAVLAAGVIGGLVVKGKSADIVGGKDFTATLLRDLPLEASGGAAQVKAGFVPETVSMQTETEKERKKRLKALEKAQKG